MSGAGASYFVLVLVVVLVLENHDLPFTPIDALPDMPRDLAWERGDMTPFRGMGANMALRDAAALRRGLQRPAGSGCRL